MEEEEAGSKGSSSIKQSRHATKQCRNAKWRRRGGGSDPGRSTFLLPENDVLVDKVAQRSVHGLHAPHVKLPRLEAAAAYRAALSRRLTNAARRGGRNAVTVA